MVSDIYESIRQARKAKEAKNVRLILLVALMSLDHLDTSIIVYSQYREVLGTIARRYKAKVSYRKVPAPPTLRQDPRRTWFRRWSSKPC